MLMLPLAYIGFKIDRRRVFLKNSRDRQPVFVLSFG